MSQQTAPRQQTTTGGRLTFLHVLRAEWTKLWSVRSTWWTLGILIVVVIGFSLIEAKGMKVMGGAGLVTGSKTTYASDPAMVTTAFGQLVMAILAVLTITGEFATGEIRTSLLAAPGRWRTLAAKALIVAAVAFVTTFLATYFSMLCDWPLVRSVVTVDDRFTLLGLRVMAGAGLAVALVALTALGIGVLVRNTALSILIVVALTFVLAAIFQSVPVHWMQTASNYIIGNSIDGIMAPKAEDSAANDVMSFGRSLWVSALWAFVPLLGGLVALRRRDA